MGHYKEIDGEVFGNYQIIGDTGKRDKNGRRIYIARHLETGKFFESPKDNYMRGHTNGYITSREHINQFEEMYKNRKANGIYDFHLIPLRQEKRKTGYRNIHFVQNRLTWEVQIIFKQQLYRKKFKNFSEAVMCLYDFHIKNINKFIKDELLKHKKIDYCDVKFNEYVIQKQKEIDKSIYEKYKKQKGYSYSKERNKYESYININGKRKSLGRYENKQDAINARQEAVEKYFNEKGDF